MGAVLSGGKRSCFKPDEFPEPIYCLATQVCVLAKGRRGGMCAGAGGSRTYLHQDVNFLMHMTTKQEPKLSLRQWNNCNYCFLCKSGLSLDFSTQKQLFRCPVPLSFRGKSWNLTEGQCTKFCQPKFRVYLHFTFQISISFISPRRNIVIYIPSDSILNLFCSL